MMHFLCVTATFLSPSLHEGVSLSIDYTTNVHSGRVCCVVSRDPLVLNMNTGKVFSLVPRLSKGGGGKESLVAAHVSNYVLRYDVLMTFVLTSALIDF